MNYNAPGIGGPGYSRREDQLFELVVEYMIGGMSQAEAEIAAACKLDELDEIAAMDAGEDAFERQQEGDRD